MASLQKIDHIVVLMLENRSFDSLLGTLYPKSDSFEGLNCTEQNPRCQWHAGCGLEQPRHRRNHHAHSQSGSRRAMDRHQHATVWQLHAYAGSETYHGRLCPKLSRPTAIKPATNLRSEKRDALF